MLCRKPNLYLQVHLYAGCRFASWMVGNSRGLGCPLALRGKLLAPSQAYKETVSQRFVRALTLIVGMRIFTAQFIPMGFSPYLFSSRSLTRNGTIHSFLDDLVLPMRE